MEHDNMKAGLIIKLSHNVFDYLAYNSHHVREVI